jgi:hypothetical protein
MVAEKADDIARRIADLLAARPDKFASPEECAVWYEGNAAVMEEIAAQSPENAAKALKSARREREHAALIREANGAES